MSIPKITPDNLRRRIERYPLTPKRVEDFLIINNLEVRVSKLYKRKGECKNYSLNNYVAEIDSSQSESEQLITLAHELIHMVYDAGAPIFPSGEREAVETIIESEAKKFYKENEVFLRQILKKSLEGDYQDVPFGWGSQLRSHVQPWR